MPFDTPTQPQSPTLPPTADEVNAQVEKLAQTALADRPSCVDLLRYLIKIEREGRYREPFSLKRPRPTGKAISADFYAYRSKHFQEPMPTNTELAGRKLVGQLDLAIQRYYGVKPDPQKKGPIHIEIDRGRRGTGYKPLIEWTVLWTPKPKTTSSLISDVSQAGIEPRPDSLVECHYMGNDREAMKYVIERYHLSTSLSPKLVAVRDTHVRPSIPLRHPEDHKELESAFSAFLLGIEAGATFATLIVGHEVDREYMRMIQRATEGHGDKLKCFRLRSSGHLMNFILMDYDDFTSEVLFGWGQGKPGWAGAVFQSKDRRLVEEFSNLYEVLLQASDRVPAESLLDTPVGKDRERNPRQVL